MSSNGSAAGSATSVLFVCLGNICRSPAAEGVFKTLLAQRGLAERIHCDSCGTGGGSGNWYKPGGWSYHEGDLPDGRMMTAAQKRGIILTSRSRPLVRDDLRSFNIICVMDSSNASEVMKAATAWGPDYQALAKEKVRLMTSYCRSHKANEVPDPYYGGKDGFELVLDLLDDACKGLLDSLL